MGVVCRPCRCRSSTPARRWSRCAPTCGPPWTASWTAARSSSGPSARPSRPSSRAHLGVPEAIGVANGTEALTIALRALGVGPGDDVVVPSFSFYASAEAVPPTGARPVFCDVDPATFCVTPDTVRAALTPATKAVIAVHLFGNVAPVAEIEALGAARRRGRRAGRRHDLARRTPGRARHDRHPVLLPVEEPRRLRRRRRGRHARRDAGRRRPHAALPRLGRQGHLHRGGLQLAPRRAAGRGPAGDAAAPRRLGRPPCDGRRLVRRGGPGRAGDPAHARRPAPGRRGTSTWRATSGPTTRSRRSAPRASARAPTTARRSTASPRWPASIRPPGGALPGTDEAARTHLALPVSAAITRRQVDEVVGALRDARLG